MSFERPEILLLLVALLPLLRRPAPIRLPAAPLAWADDPEGEVSTAAVRSLAAVTRAALVLGIAGLLAVAARPVVERPAPIAPEESVAVMLVVDVSGSMVEPRIGGSALDRTRAAVLELGAEAPGIRLGVVAFAGTAVTRIPPTTDTALVRTTLETAELGIDGNGSAIGTALGLAVERLRVTEAAERAVVLVSDGRHNAGAIAPETVAELALEAGIAVHALLPFATSSDGAVERMRTLTSGTGGRTAVALREDGGLGDALRELVPETAPAGPPIRTAANEVWLWPALLLLALASVLRATRIGGIE